MQLHLFLFALGLAGIVSANERRLCVCVLRVHVGMQPANERMHVDDYTTSPILLPLLVTQHGFGTSSL